MTNEMTIRKEETAIWAPPMGDKRAALVQTLSQTVYKGAKPQMVELILDYCAARQIDPILKPVHIVPMGGVDTLMPGIYLYRILAARTGEYAGKSEPRYGAMISERMGSRSIRFPEWCSVTVKRLIAGVEREFTATEYFDENVGTNRDGSPNAMWSKRPRAQLAKCFDGETEILTTNGFELFSAVTGKVLEATEKGLRPCDSKPFFQRYSGDMIVSDGTRLNFSVTPNHNMITSLGDMDAEYLYKIATKDATKVAIPRFATNNNPDFDVSDDRLKLLGYFLADGSVSYNMFRIAVSRPYKVKALEEMGLFYRKAIKVDAGRVSILRGREVKTNFDKINFYYKFDLVSFFVNRDKSIIVDNFLKLSARQAEIVVDAMIEFDGNIAANGAKHFFQTNKNVISFFEIAVSHAQKSLSFRHTRASGYYCTVSDKKDFCVVTNVTKNGSSLKIEKNNGNSVWCVTVPSGRIIVRRKGFSMLCGNCTEAQALRMAFPEALGGEDTNEETRVVVSEPVKAPTVDRIEVPRATNEQIEKIGALVKDWSQERVDGMMKHYGVAVISDMDTNVADDAIGTITKRNARDEGLKKQVQEQAAITEEMEAEFEEVQA